MRPGVRIAQFLLPAYRTHGRIIQIKGRLSYVMGQTPSFPSCRRLRRVFPLSLLILAWPLVEIAAFVAVGSKIGILPTIGLVVLSGVVGAVLLRIQGFGVLSRIREQVEAGRDPSRELAHGVMILVAAILLLIPGFVTDIVGILLFIPPIRDLGWRLLRQRVDVVGRFGDGTAWRRPAAGRGDRTIDLDQDDYSRRSEGPSPWRRLDGDRDRP